MEIRIDDVIIGDRFRQDLGDVEELAQSIAEVGLLHPIVITLDNVLIAGRRRLEAARLLGLVDIPATVVDLQEIARGEFAENEIRKDFTWSERVEILQSIKPVEKEAAKQRQLSGKPPYNLEEGGEVMQRAAKSLGTSHMTLRKAEEICDSGDDELIAKMDRTGKVTGSYRELKRRKDAEHVATVSPPQGTYRTIVIDPPWDWGDEKDVSQMGRSKPTYSTIPLAGLRDLPIPSLADDDCHLYLWITNRSLYKGFDLIGHWGFRYITTLTWCKPSIGIGNYFRNNTEHLLFAVKGSLRLLRFDVGTWFVARRGSEHSGKPQEAYDLIVSCSPLPRLDMFARQERDGFSAWGNVNGQS